MEVKTKHHYFYSELDIKSVISSNYCLKLLPSTLKVRILTMTLPFRVDFLYNSTSTQITAIYEDVIQENNYEYIL